MFDHAAIVPSNVGALDCAKLSLPLERNRQMSDLLGASRPWVVADEGDAMEGLP